MSDHGLPESDDAVTTSVAYQDGTAIVTVSGEIDLATVPTLNEAITEAFTHQPAALVVDLSAVGFLASVGLQTLVVTHESAGEATRFAVVADGPATSRPIQLTGLDKVFALYPTLDEALAHVRGH